MRTNSANAKSTTAAPAFAAVASSANGASCIVTANGVRIGTRWLALAGRNPVYPVHPAACAMRIPSLAFTKSWRLNS